MPQEFELADDGEFAEPVDTSYGVYSAQRKTWLFPILMVFFSLFACALIFMAFSFFAPI